jgi:uncharacterized membrane protein
VGRGDDRNGARIGGRSNVTAYEIYKLIHVYSVIAWFGGGVMLHLLMVRSRSTKDARLMARLAQIAVVIGRGFFTPMSLITLISGILMVAITPGLGFADLWILIGFGGIVVSAGLAMSVLAPANRGLAELVQTRGTIDTDVKNAARRGIVAQRIDIVVLAIAVWAMVTKPGW